MPVTTILLNLDLSTLGRDWSFDSGATRVTNKIFFISQTLTTWKSCKESGKTFIVYAKDTDGNYTEEIKLTCSTGTGMGVITSTLTYSSGTI